MFTNLARDPLTILRSVVNPVLFRWSLAGLLVTVLAGMGLDLMEVDAAQYAAMASELLDRGAWTHLYFRGSDYLDKPPLLFWSAMASHALFGVSDWSYRLPSVLSAFLGLFALYRFTELHHGTDAARRAVAVMGCSAAFLLMTNDVRTDTLLTAAVICTIWTGSVWMEQRRWWALIACGVSLGAGLLAKGPIAAVAPGLAFGMDALWRRRWERLVDPAWLLVLVIAVAMMLPMFIGLHEQHGLHGIRFFLWEQSFGRITGENRWKDDSTPLYFLHELPWLLLPWTIFLFRGSIRGFRGISAHGERITLLGACAVFAALSLSRFKLPHYLYVTLPLFAVVAARGMEQAPRIWWRIHLVLLLLLLLAAAAIAGWSFSSAMGLAFALGCAVLAASLFRLWGKGAPDAVIAATCYTMVTVGLTMNLHVYPALLRFQANAQAGRWAANNQLDAAHFYGLQVAGTSLDRYAGFHVHWLSNIEEASTIIRPGVHIYTDVAHEEALKRAGYRPVRVASWMNTSVQLVGLDFLVPERRMNSLKEHVMLRF